MRTIIAGGRNFGDVYLLNNTMKMLHDLGLSVTSVTCGEATGADKLGKQWAEQQFLPVDSHRAKWKEYGKSAGYIRNAAMAECSDLMVAFWDGKSKGTKHMIDLALKKGLLVQVVKYKG